MSASPGARLRGRIRMELTNTTEVLACFRPLGDDQPIRLPIGGRRPVARPTWCGDPLTAETGAAQRPGVHGQAGTRGGGEVEKWT